MLYRTLSFAVSFMNFLWLALMENKRCSWPLERCWPEGYRNGSCGRGEPWCATRNWRGCLFENWRGRGRSEVRVVGDLSEPCGSFGRCAGGRIMLCDCNSVA